MPSYVVSLGYIYIQILGELRTYFLVILPKILDRTGRNDSGKLDNACVGWLVQFPIELAIGTYVVSVLDSSIISRFTQS